MEYYIRVAGFVNAIILLKRIKSDLLLGRSCRILRLKYIAFEVFFYLSRNIGGLEKTHCSKKGF